MVFVPYKKPLSAHEQALSEAPEIKLAITEAFKNNGKSLMSSSLS
jgi:hypothetical protein